MFAGDDVECTGDHGGHAAENKGINLPGISVKRPRLTEKTRSI